MEVRICSSPILLPSRGLRGGRQLLRGCVCSLRRVCPLNFDNLVLEKCLLCKAACCVVAQMGTKIDVSHLLHFAALFSTSVTC